MAKKTVPKTAKKKTVTTAKKKPAKKKTAKGSKKKPAKPAAPKVRVRMFRHGLGDCFLVTFDVGRDEKHMLIDCGTLGNKRTQVKIPDVAKEIQSTIAGGRLDVVVATHEHKDHLSGFRNKEMQKLEGQVGNVWLAWTENPEDEDAKSFATHKHDLGQALAAIALAAAESPEGQQIAHLLGFAGTVAGMDDLADADDLATADMLGADFAETVHEAMEFVRLKLAPERSYWDPGTVFTEDWLPGFRIYVLGPPRGEEFMADMGDHHSEELYHVASALRTAARLHFAAKEMSAEEMAECQREQPFDQRFVERGDELMRLRYPAFFADADQWRRIDVDWLSAATDLALQLDKMTNNSSLALAIERIADGKVLLFPADAQQGNWLSWHGLKWKVPGKSQPVGVEDLLRRTVFYKVGHHASHNATLRDKGLELMPPGELTAFIPVDREIALSRNPKGSWQMPAFHLYRRLLEICEGRVARSDLGWASPPEEGDGVEEEFSSLATEEEWQSWASTQQEAEKLGQVRVRPEYIDYLLE